MHKKVTTSSSDHVVTYEMLLYNVGYSLAKKEVALDSKINKYLYLSNIKISIIVIGIKPFFFKYQLVFVFMTH